MPVSHTTLTGSYPSGYTLTTGYTTIAATGTVANGAGVVTAAVFGAAGAGAYTVVNAGSVLGGNGEGVGLYGTAGGAVTNQSSGTIVGGYYGITVAGPATVSNAGRISGGTDAVKLHAGETNRLIIDPGAVFTGTVDGGNAIGATSISTLELASGTSAGTLTSLGSQYVNFAQVTVDTSASWLLSGNNTIVSGATLTNTGTLTNAGTLLDNGTLNGGGTLVNDGSISVAAAGALSLSNGSLTNAAHGTIIAYNGIAMTGGGAVSNAGLIAGTGAQSYGVSLQGGSLINQQDGTIEAVYNAVLNFGGTLTNYGLIDGSGAIAIGVQAEDGGLIVNAAHATITAPNLIALAMYSAAGTVSNAGVISGDGGIFLFDGGTVTNRSGGVIAGGNFGVQALNVSSTVINAGTISATDAGKDAVSLAARYTDRLIIDPGAVFTGTVDGGNAIGATSISTLELASAASIGTLTGFGSTYVDFARITIDVGASWALTGANDFAAGTTLSNAGKLTVSHTTVVDAGA